jgi:hypothetical protein
MWISNETKKKFEFWEAMDFEKVHKEIGTRGYKNELDESSLSKVSGFGIPLELLKNPVSNPPNLTFEKLLGRAPMKKEKTKFVTKDQLRLWLLHTPKEEK